jgi:exopolyphosphatase / guanosine-5'-triphosphate,3'-diphosphate pyrophosphatase
LAEVSRLRPDPTDDAARVAVIDVGSNSVRLVVYDRIGRTPIPIYNERLLCGLGRGVAASGQLDPQATDRALAALARFAALARAMDVERTDSVATAAVREANDGQAFVARAAAHTGLEIRILSGREEARLSALGVLAAVPGAIGLMGDLGGGSLELVTLTGDEVGSGATLPLGPLRLALPADVPASAAAGTIDEAFSSLPWLAEAKDRELYAVGGAWRALGHIEMQRKDYPLRVLQGYTVEADEMHDVAAATARMSPASLQRVEGVSKERLAMLPLAAQVLLQLIEKARPKRVVFSVYGLREGLLYAQLPESLKRADPLLAACQAVAETEARFPGQGAVLVAWSDPLFAGETAAERRLRQAAALLSDSGWRTHPDYRAEQAFLDVVRGPIVGLDHNERARLALMVYARYTGKSETGQVADVKALMDDAEALHARQVGKALRLALTITGGVPLLLRGITVERLADRIVLRATPDAAHLIGHVVRRRLEALARSMNLSAEVVEG